MNRAENFPPALPLGRIAIIGTGLIGASIGLAARAEGYHVVGSDINAGHARRAAELKAIDSVVPDASAFESDILVIAAPATATADFLRSLARCPSPAQTIIDVASVMSPIIDAAAGLANFVTTHPMAGSERNGPEAARAGLFLGRSWIIDPSAPEPHRRAVVDFVQRLGARPFLIDPKQHDRTVALTSHLPQLLSVVLAAQLRDLDDLSIDALCGSGVASMTRLASSSWAVWESIFAQNAANVAQQTRTLSKSLLDIATQLGETKTAALARTFEAAAPIAHRIARNHIERR